MEAATSQENFTKRKTISEHVTFTINHNTILNKSLDQLGETFEKY